MFREFSRDMLAEAGGILEQLALHSGQDTSGRPPIAEPGTDLDGTGFLLALGWVIERHGIASLPPDLPAATLRNRLVLLSIACRFQRIFQLPTFDATGVCFIGGILNPSVIVDIEGMPAVLYVGGCGATFGRAFEKAIGEGIEHLSTLEWRSERLVRFAPDQAMASCPDERQKIEWMPALDPLTGDVRLVPADQCLRRSTDRRGMAVRKASSNGCAAGANLAEAILSATLELVERDAIALWWGTGRTAWHPEIVTEDGDMIAAVIARLRPGSERPLRMLDISTEIGIPVMAAVTDDGNGREAAVGFGAALDPLAAVEKAVTEVCQVEIAYAIVAAKVERDGSDTLSDMERQHLERMRGYDLTSPSPLADRSGIRRWTREPQVGTGTALTAVLERLRAVGLRCDAIDLTRHEIGCSVARVLVPGLQSVKESLETDRMRRTRERYGRRTPTTRQLPPPI